MTFCLTFFDIVSRTKKALPPAPPLGPMPNGSFLSTVDSWNRERDQQRIEQKLSIPEEGGWPNLQYLNVFPRFLTNAVLWVFDRIGELLLSYEPEICPVL